MMKWIEVAVLTLFSLAFAVGLLSGDSSSALHDEVDGLPWWNGTVFYEVFLRSFSDSNADGIGDINGLISKLDYLNDGDQTSGDDLGVTGIWLMPVMPSPSYHGYDVTDYLGIQPDYGTLDDFRRLVEESHARGIRVVIDLMLNHTSTQHPWFQQAVSDPDSRYRDYYLWTDEDPGYAGPFGGQAWHPTDTGFYYAAFWGGMPDLNLENPEVIREINKITRFWLKDVGVDGFRLDAIKHFVEEGQNQANTSSTHRWLESYHRTIKSISRSAVAVGEAWDSTQNIVQYVGDEVDLAFEFDISEAILTSVQRENAGAVRTAFDVGSRLYPPHQYATFLTNHDQNRLMSQLEGNVTKAKLAASLLLTNPGVPFIYYGEEIGMLGEKPDEDIRLPMRWDESTRYGFSEKRPWRLSRFKMGGISVETQMADTDSLLNHYRRLIQLRNEHRALATGDWFKVSSSNSKIFAAIRQNSNETLLILLNLSDEEITDFKLRFSSGSILSAHNAQELFARLPVQPPELTAEGKFADYQPLDSMPATSTLVIKIE